MNLFEASKWSHTCAKLKNLKCSGPQSWPQRFYLRPFSHRTIRCSRLSRKVPRTSSRRGGRFTAADSFDVMCGTMPSLNWNLNLLASHTMGNLLPGFLLLAFMWSTVPILACALLGARVGWAPFRWRRIGGAALGVLIGAATLPPASFLSVWLAAQIDLPPMLPRLIAFIAGGCFASSWVAYSVARIGRPATQVPTIEMLNENCEKLERIIRGRVPEGGLEVGANPDADAMQVAGILTHDQSVRLEEIRLMRNKLMQSRAVLHEDVAFWGGKSKELLDELDRQPKKARHQTTSNRETIGNAPVDENPYKPPAAGASSN